MMVSLNCYCFQLQICCSNKTWRSRFGWIEI